MKKEIFKGWIPRSERYVFYVNQSLPGQPLELVSKQVTKKKLKRDSDGIILTVERRKKTNEVSK